MKSAMMAKPDTKGLVSGSSTVKVSLYGRVNQMVRFAATPHDSAFQALDNTHSGSRFGIRASGSINKNLTASSQIEVGVNGASRFGSGFENGAAAPSIGTRITDVSLAHKDLGTVTVGHGWNAGSGAMVASFSGTTHVLNIWGPDGDGIKATKGANISGKPRYGSTPLSAYGFRTGRILYRTPSLMGVSLEASHNQNKGWSAGLGISGLPGIKDVGFALNVGYVSTPGQPARGAATLEPADDTPATKGSTGIGVSGAFKHNASGLNINASYGQEQAKGGAKVTGWMVDGGWSGKLTDAGDTSVTVGYGQWGDGVHGLSTRYHFAINQNIASAATDVYFGVGYDTGDVTHTVAHTPAVTAADATSGFTPVTDRPDRVVIDTGAPAVDAVMAKAAVPDEGCGGAEEIGGNQTYPVNGTKCAVSRDGVFVIVAGVLIKF